MKRLRKPYEIIVTLFLFLLFSPEVLSQKNPGRFTEAQKLYQQGNFKEAIELWQKDIQENSETSHLAKLAQAQAYLDLGNLVAANELLNQTYPDKYIPYQEAIKGNLALRQGLFNEAIEIYNKLANLSYFNPINRLTLLDNYLESLLDQQTYHRNQLEETQDPYQIELLKQAIASNEQITANITNNAQYLAETTNLLNSPAAIGIRVKIFDFYPPSSPTKLKILLAQILDLPDSYDKGKLLLEFAELSPTDATYEQAIKVAIALDNPQLKSWAFGDYGQYLYQRGNLGEALAITYKAISDANENQDFTKLAQLNYQTALIQEKLGNSLEAAKAYDLSIINIKHLRERLAGHPINPLLIAQIQPILQSYLEFLLKSDHPSKANLQKAIEIQGLSTLTEVDSFFRQVCDSLVKVNEKIPDGTALIYTVILRESTYLIVKIGDSIYHHRIKINEPNLNTLIFRWRLDILQDKNFDFAETSKYVYQSFILPIESILEKNDIKSLIFIQDGILRTISMSTAFDEIEKKYLIEKYLISYSLGLKYPSNLKLRSNKLSALFAGNSKTSQNNLWGIEKEITNLAHLNFDDSDILIDTEFSEQSLFSKLKQHNYSILHIALHNQIGKTITDSQLFIRDNKTFSLTQFEQILRSSDYQLNLLTLAACDTALGDRYAVLGLAGLSLRTGTPNLIGSLWAVPDSSSFLAMKVFYESILKGDNVAQAFQKMQVSQIRSNSAENIHPSKWGGYILIL